MELWEKSFKKALEIQNKKDYEEASYYFVNALSFAPGNLVLIKGFTKLLNDWSQQYKINGDDLSAFQQLERAENFIVNSVPFVSPDELPELLNILKETKNIKEELSKESPIEEDPREIEARKDLALYKEGKFNSSDQGTAIELQQRLEKLQLVHELMNNTIDEDSIIKSKLEKDIYKLQLGLQYENLFEEAERLISLAKSKADKSSAAMILQHSENLIRQLLTWPEKDHRAIRIETLLIILKKEADQISDASRKEESELIYDDFYESQQSNMQKANAWSVSSIYTSDRNCQKQIELLSIIMRALQEVLPKLNHIDASNKAFGLAEKLTELMNQANNAQSKRYNGWVMSQMKEAMKAGNANTSFYWDNEVTLCNNMKTIFGQIDTRYLTFEVNRCYSEVFEELFKHLHSPKNENDFEKEGSKLKLLKEIFEHKKISIQDF